MYDAYTILYLNTPSEMCLHECFKCTEKCVLVIRNNSGNTRAPLTIIYFTALMAGSSVQ